MDLRSYGIRFCAVSMAMWLELFAPAPTMSAEQTHVSAGASMYTLRCGARVVLHCEPSCDLAGIGVFIRQDAPGSAADAATAAIVAQTLLTGSQSHPQEMLAQVLAGDGCTFTSLQTSSYIEILCLAPAAKAADACYSLCDALTNPDFHPAALERARAQWRALQSPSIGPGPRDAYEALNRLLEPAAQADEYHIERVAQEGAVQYFRTHFTPDRVVFSIGGQFSPESVRDALSSGMAALANSPPRASVDQLQSDVLGQTMTFITTGDAAYALVATAAPPVASVDYPAFLVLQALLGEGHASRLFRHLRDRLGIGYDVGAEYDPARRGPLIAYVDWSVFARADLSRQDPVTVLKLLNAELEDLCTTAPPDREMERARNLAIGLYTVRHERLTERVRLLGWYECVGPGFAFDTKLPKMIAAVQPVDILRIARRYLHTRAQALVLPAHEP